MSALSVALEKLAAGGMIILVDDEDRENEGDLVCAAEFATPEVVNFMSRFGRGLICLSLPPEHVDRLGLPQMVARNRTARQTGFTVSIEARTGVTTGISAFDRARTIEAAIADGATARSGTVIPRRPSTSPGWPVSSPPPSSARSSRRTAPWPAVPIWRCLRQSTTCRS